MSDDIPRLLDVTVFPYLDSGERLLWTGKPRPGLRLSGPGVGNLLGSVIWAAVAVYFAVSIWRGGVSVSNFVAAVALVGYALYSTVGRIALDAWLRSRTRYAVTDHRVLIIQGGNQPTIQSIDLTATTQVTPDLRGDGSGSLTFGEGQLVASGRRGRTRRQPPPAFDDIPDAQQAYDLIQQVMRTPRPDGLEDGTRTNADDVD